MQAGKYFGAQEEDRNSNSNANSQTNNQQIMNAHKSADVIEYNRSASNAVCERKQITNLQSLKIALNFDFLSISLLL